ncbi:MAG: exopolysaccharide biosynthesis protein [Phycisphaeraceae bacterium]
MANNVNDTPQDLEDLLNDINQQVSDNKTISIDDLLDAIGSRAFGPLLAVPALLVVSPLGFIPGLPTTFALLTILIAAQHLLGRKYPWIPEKLRDLEVPADKWDNAYSTIKPWATRIDHFISPRLIWLAKGRAEYVISLMAIALATCMPPLELIPFAVFIPGTTLLLLGLAIAAHDGLLVLIAITGIAASVYLIYTTLL